MMRRCVPHTAPRLFLLSARTSGTAGSSTLGSASELAQHGRGKLRASFGGISQMFQQARSLVLANLLVALTATHTYAAEREDVRKAINLVTSVKMPYPENLARNRAKTERVWLEREGATTGCIKCWMIGAGAMSTSRHKAIARKCCAFATSRRAASRLAPCTTTSSTTISTASSTWGRQRRSRGHPARRLPMSSNSSPEAPSAAKSSKPTSKGCTTRASRSP